MGRELALDSLTVKVNTVGPTVPSFWLTSLIEMVAAPPSLTIVPTPWLSLIVALTGFVRLTKNVSLGSNLVSPLTVTATGWLVTLFIKCYGPPPDLHSSPARRAAAPAVA